MRYIVRTGNSQVIVPDQRQALGMAGELLSKGKSVELHPTARPATHKNTYHAMAALEVAEMGLEEVA